MLRFDFKDGRVEIQRPDLEDLLLQLDVNARHQAAAEAAAMMRVYKLGELDDEDRQNPHIGLLRHRLGIGEKSARFLITSGAIAHIPCGGKKNYRVTEYAVRQHLGVPMPALPRDLLDKLQEVLQRSPAPVGAPPKTRLRRAA